MILAISLLPLMYFRKSEKHEDIDQCSLYRIAAADSGL